MTFDWLHIIAVIALALGMACSIAMTIVVIRRPPKMAIMKVVWPITALYAGPLALWLYAVHERKKSEQRSQQRGPPSWDATAVAATHCGSGCTLGDIVAEWGLFFLPLSLLGHRIFAAWAVDYVLAFLFGIAFQYFTIQPMRKLSPREGLIAAVKADTLSLSAWQIGMYGWMAIVTFLIFGHELEKTGPVFWFVMQIAMLFGFATSYPVNSWLLRSGRKERM